MYSWLLADWATIALLPEPGCSQCHRGITIGDWRDPLDPELDAQVIVTQYQQARSALIKKHLPGEEDGSCAREGSASPTSSCGATSLPEEGGGAVEVLSSPRMEHSCRDLIRVIDDLSYQHLQILASPTWMFSVLVSLSVFNQLCCLTICICIHMHSHVTCHVHKGSVYVTVVLDGYILLHISLLSIQDSTRVTFTSTNSKSWEV